MGGVLCGDNSLTSLVLDGCTRLWELRFDNNGLSGELDLSPFSLTRIASEGNRLETIYVPQDPDPDATYFARRSQNFAYNKKTKCRTGSNRKPERAPVL